MVDRYDWFPRDREVQLLWDHNTGHWPEWNSAALVYPYEYDPISGNGITEPPRPWRIYSPGEPLRFVSYYFEGVVNATDDFRVGGGTYNWISVPYPKILPLGSAVDAVANANPLEDYFQIRMVARVRVDVDLEGDPLKNGYLNIGIAFRNFESQEELDYYGAANIVYGQLRPQLDDGGYAPGMYPEDFGRIIEYEHIQIHRKEDFLPYMRSGLQLWSLQTQAIRLNDASPLGEYYADTTVNVVDWRIYISPYFDEYFEGEIDGQQVGTRAHIYRRRIR